MAASGFPPRFQGVAPHGLADRLSDVLVRKWYTGVVAFEGKTNREIYVEAHRAAGELVRRYEQLLDLVPSRRNELAVGNEETESVRIAERAFREIYERLRDVREALEDGKADAAALEGPEPD